MGVPASCVVSDASCLPLRNTVTVRFLRPRNLTSRPPILARQGAEFPFFAILSLEFLARSVLAKIHPSLLADPQDPNSILYANGIPATDKPRSVPAKIVFLRLKSIVGDFSKEDEAHCLRFAELRNRELHSGGAPFENLPTGSWIPELYTVTYKLMNHHGLDLQELFGEEEATAAQRIIGELLEEDKTTVETLKADIRKKFEYLTAPEKMKRIDEHTPEFEWARLKTGEVVKSEKCPCCENKGFLVGEVTGKRLPSLDEDQIVSKLIVTPRFFRCSICGFKIEGYGKLRIVSLADQFEFAEVLDPVDYFGIEPMDYISDEQMRDYFAPDDY